MPSPSPTVDDSSTPTFGVANWRSLGTYVQLVVAGERHLDAARALAVRLLDDVDRTCSRFRDDSDLTRANRNAGGWTRVDPLLAAAVAAAVRAAEQTRGLVDPTLGRSLVAAGYDRDFDAVRLDDGPAAIPVPALPDAWRMIEIDPEGGLLVPHGVALDLGATGKAFASDLVAGAIAEQVGAGCVLSLGGDVAVGTPGGARAADDADAGATAGVPWRVAVSELVDGDPDTTVVLRSGGLATSTVLARRWHRGGRVVHHLLDPATGRPVTRTWRTASVAAPTCLVANTASTASILLGAAAPAWLERFGVTARLVDTAGRITVVGEWLQEEGLMFAAFTGGPVLWYANRATGVVLVVLLTASTAMGVYSTARSGSVRWPRFATQALHRNVSLLSMVMLVLHVTSAVVDTYVDIRWYDVFVPFVGKYEAEWLGIGTVASDLLLAVVLTSLVRDRLQHRGWRAVHLLAYPAWAVGVVHGLGIGTDSFTAWGLSISAVSIGVVAAFGVVRLLTLANERRLAA